MNERNKTILEGEMNTEFILKYIEEEIKAISISEQPVEKDKAISKIPPRFQFANRFPVTLWDHAAVFFGRKG